METRGTGQSQWLVMRVCYFQIIIVTHIKRRISVRRKLLFGDAEECAYHTYVCRTLTLLFIMAFISHRIFLTRRVLLAFSFVNYASLYKK